MDLIPVLLNLAAGAGAASIAAVAWDAFKLRRAKSRANPAQADVVGRDTDPESVDISELMATLDSAEREIAEVKTRLEGLST
ncbi:hypothetical protein ASD37_18095 [Mycobacterium sp. Root135]|uniref:hypothetical protein n=1 Tax=Mycobacterium sp. Root135 TaxID=1736457 RepID=UPI0006FD02EE|nr:hypothetical protein [Mycobacterium sp. Root135]KQY06218.1 hypothetical protein ASD37_18095 [Mycobacterium sp. Root135]